MFLIKTEQDLLRAFRPRDRKVFEHPTEIRYPQVALDYYSWVESSGVRAYLVLQEPASKRLLGITFRRDVSGGEALNSRMCDWCHSMGSADQVGLITADRNSKRRMGVIACRDLGCKERVQDLADRSGRSAVKARREVVERMLRFAREALGIESVPDDVSAA